MFAAEPPGLEGRLPRTGVPIGGGSMSSSSSRDASAEEEDVGESVGD